jgi:alpha/beta superfamily hydrolase
MLSETLLEIATPRGVVQGVYHDAEGALSAVVMVSGALGGVVGPSRAYPALAGRLAAVEIATLRLDYRAPGNMNECVYDLDAGLNGLRDRGFGRFALVGWSFGGAVVISSGVAHSDVLGVATLASQTAGAAAVSRLAPRSLLLLHGTADLDLPDGCSRYLYQEAHEPKRLLLSAGDNHQFSRSYAEVVQTLFDWAVGLLAPDASSQEER